MHKQLKFNTMWFKKDKKEKELKYKITNSEEFRKDLHANSKTNNQIITGGSYISANQYYSSNFGSGINNQSRIFTPKTQGFHPGIYEISYQDRDELIKYISSLTSDIPNHIKFLLHIPVVQKEITTIKGSKKKLNI